MLIILLILVLLCSHGFYKNFVAVIYVEFRETFLNTHVNRDVQLSSSVFSSTVLDHMFYNLMKASLLNYSFLW